MPLSLDMSCETMALSLLLDAVDDVTGRDRTDLRTEVYRDTEGGEGKRLKDNALDFFFSRESESCCEFWCDMAGEDIDRFRKRVEKYK